MRVRIPGAAASPVAVDQKRTPRAWLRTSGGATPSLDTSYGVTSITDAGVGQLDVTWTVACASGTSYAVVPTIFSSQVQQRVAFVSNATVPTATVARLVCNNTSAGNTTDPTSGFMCIMVGE